MLFTSPGLAIVTIFFILIQAVIEKMAEKKLKDANYRTREMEKKVHKCREESFSNIRTVKHFSCEGKQSDLIKRYLNDDREVRKSLVHAWAMRCCCKEVLMGFLLIFTWYCGLSEVYSGRSTIGEISSFSLLVRIVRDAAMDIFTTYGDTIKSASFFSIILLVF